MVAAGVRYWARTGTNENGQPLGHFFFVLIDPHGNDRITLIVPYCTIRRGFVDRTCVLRRDKHTFLQSDSYVDYRYADTKSGRDIDREVTNGEARIFDTIPPALVEEILRGLLASSFTRRMIKLWYDEYRQDQLFLG